MATSRGARPPLADPLRQLRQQHEAMVLSELTRSGPLTRAELTTRTGLSRTTLFAIVAELLAAGVLVAHAEHRGGRGRPRQRIAVNPASSTHVGVDIGRAHCHVAMLDAAHQVIAQGSDAYAVDEDLTVRIGTAQDLLDRLTSDHAVSTSGLQRVGLALHGIVQDPGTTPGSSTLSAPAATAKTAFEERYGAPVEVENNTRCAALAELTWGDSRDCADVLYLRCSDGISSAAIVDGQLLRGAHGLAGELGHAQVDPDGAQCYCGACGCLELTAGIPALLDACHKAGRPLADAEELVARARSDDGVVLTVVKHAVSALSSVCAKAVMQVDPARVIVSGELAALGDLVLEPLRRGIAEQCLPSYTRQVDVTTSSLPDVSGAMGAVAHILRSTPGETAQREGALDGAITRSRCP